MAREAIENESVYVPPGGPEVVNVTLTVAPEGPVIVPFVLGIEADKAVPPVILILQLKVVAVPNVPFVEERL